MVTTLFQACAYQSYWHHNHWCENGICFFCTIRAAGGYGSESEAEDTAESHVTLPQDLPGRGNIKSEKSSVKITEVSRACAGGAIYVMSVIGYRQKFTHFSQ